jgi:hypothetical protein
MEHDLEYYVSNLGSKEQLYTDSLGIFEQSILYPDKPNPLQKNAKSPIIIPINIRPQKYVNTHSLWCSIAGLIDEIHIIQTPTMKKQNVQFLTDSLKEYLSDKTIHSFLTGRRIYPLMELIDKPKILYEIKHQHALGYFLSFLFDISVYLNDSEYRWSNDCDDGDIRLMKNNDGYWFIEKK